MISSGVNAFRLNTSHIGLSDLNQWIERLSKFSSCLEKRPDIVLDLQGSKWRIGHISTCILDTGKKVRLVLAESSNQKGIIPVPHEDFFDVCRSSSKEIFLNDAKIQLETESFGNDSITAKVVKGGELSSRKGITYLSSDYRIESLNHHDRQILEQTRDTGLFRYAISYIRDASEMKRYRDMFGSNAHLIAKIEREKAIADASQIARYADAIWLCRGDLGAELGQRSMAEAVHGFSAQINDLRVPVHMAGQILEHMKDSCSPTRSEICFMYDALLAGYRGFVLSDETAIGRYAPESCKVAALFKD